MTASLNAAPAARPSGLRTRVATSIAAALLLAACGGGPSDYVETAAPVAEPAGSSVPLRTAAQQDALERDLANAGSAQASAGNRADASLPSAMALAIIRQQQNEEARKLLDETSGGVAPAAAPCDPSQVVCPATPTP